MPSLIEFDDKGQLLLFLVLVTSCFAIYVLFTCNKENLGQRYLVSLRCLILANVFWQICSCIYVFYNADASTLRLLGTIRALSGLVWVHTTNYFNIIYFDGFSRITKFESRNFEFLKYVSAIFTGYSIIAKIVDYALPSGIEPGIQYAGYLLLVPVYIMLGLGKNIYLLRLIYLETLKAVSPERTRTKDRLDKKYHIMTIGFSVLLVLEVIMGTLWTYGLVTSQERYVIIGQTSTAFQIYFYPKLVQGLKDLISTAQLTTSAFASDGTFSTRP